MGVGDPWANVFELSQPFGIQLPAALRWSSTPVPTLVVHLRFDPRAVTE